jgi:hypothetical protein
MGRRRRTSTLNTEPATEPVIGNQPIETKHVGGKLGYVHWMFGQTFNVVEPQGNGGSGEGVTVTYLGGMKVLTFKCDPEKTLAVVHKAIQEKAPTHRIRIHLADVQKSVEAALPKGTVEGGEGTRRWVRACR